MKSLFSWKGKTILIVEDDNNSFIYLSEILKRAEPNILRAKSGLSAFFHCINYPRPDIVLMDIKLPEMSGYDSTRLIKKYQPGIPIIALTACAMLDEKQQCLTAGCDAYMSKPALPAEVLHLINSFLTLTNAQEPNYESMSFNQSNWD